jgi:ketosteroid isomerase-like protein
MSQENVETVLKAAEAFANGGVDAMAEFWGVDINWRAVPGAPDDVGEIHGREAMRRYHLDHVDVFDDATVVLEEVLDVGDDRVVAVLHATGRAKVSGVETGIRYAVVCTVRDGRIVRGREYMDREQALEAVRMSE